MDEVLRGLHFVFPYIDDIHIASGDGTSLKQHLHDGLQRLSHYGFRFNLDKCFSVPNTLTLLDILVIVPFYRNGILLSPIHS